MAQKSMADVVSEVRCYVESSLQRGPQEHIKFLPATNSWMRGNRAVTMLSLARRVSMVLNTSTERAVNAIEIIAEDLCDKQDDDLKAWVERIDAMPECEVEARKFVSLMQHDDTDPLMHECHVWALKQWISQIKRHIMRLPVTYHVMLILHSRTEGTGKSFNIKKLVAPLDGFTREMSVDQLGEQFSHKLLAQTYVALFEEMDGVKEANAAKFKSFTTGRALAGRSMRSESGFSAENRVSCLASTNTPAPHGIENESGARRVWSVHCNEVPQRLNRDTSDALDHLNWEAIWRCVDHRHGCLEVEIPPAVAEKMQQVRNEFLRAPDSFELFWRDEVIPAENPEESVEVRQLQRAYKSYCARSSHTAIKMTIANVVSRLQEQGYTFVNHRGHMRCKGVSVLTFVEHHV